MGSTPTTALTRPETGYNPDLSTWQVIGEGDTYNIWRNRSTDQEMEEYTQATASEDQFRYLKDVFEFRYEREYIVSSVYFKESSRKQLCSTFYQGSIFLQRIPLRLNQIKDLPFPDSIHLVHSCLRGLRELYNRVGSFSVGQQMIGINSEAKVKVWISPDFGRARLNDFDGQLKNDEAGMVRDIMEITDKSIDHRTQPESLVAFIARGDRPNFQEALNRLQEYTLRHLTQIPYCLSSIAELRDRGYFKKMPPSRKTLMSRSQLSLLHGSNTFGSQSQSTPQFLGIASQGHVLPMVSTFGRAEQIPFQSPVFSRPETLLPVAQPSFVSNGHPLQINGIPVIQNSGMKVNTYYSNTPVGGRLHTNVDHMRAKSPFKPVAPSVPRASPIVPTITATATQRHTTIVQPQTLPVRQHVAPIQSQTVTHTKVSTPTNHQTNLISPVPSGLVYQTLPPSLMLTESEDSLSKVQRIIRQIKSLKSNQVVASGYIYQSFKPDYNSSALEYSIPDVSFNSNNFTALSSYIPDSEGKTHPDLLKLGRIDKDFKSSYNQFVNTSFTSPPAYDFGNSVVESSEFKLKPILKNKNYYNQDGYTDYSPSYLQQSLSVRTSKPVQPQQVRTIYNRQYEFSKTQAPLVHQNSIRKQVETYRANIKIYTPQDLRGKQPRY